MEGDAIVSGHTILAEGDRGTIKCRECGKEYPAFSPPTGRYHSGRTGWEMLRVHVKRAHPELATAVATGLAEFDRTNALITGPLRD